MTPERIEALNWALPGRETFGKEEVKELLEALQAEKDRANKAESQVSEQLRIGYYKGVERCLGATFLVPYRYSPLYCSGPIKEEVGKIILPENLEKLLKKEPEYD